MIRTHITLKITDTITLPELKRMRDELRDLPEVTICDLVLLWDGDYGISLVRDFATTQEGYGWATDVAENTHGAYLASLSGVNLRMSGDPEDENGEDYLI